MDNNAFIKQQLTFNGNRSKCEERALTVLEHLSGGNFWRLNIAYKMALPVSMVNTAIAWLQAQGYVMLDMEGQISRVTPAGKEMAKARLNAKGL